jgi:hypothetical protein
VESVLAELDFALSQHLSASSQNTFDLKERIRKDSKSTIKRNCPLTQNIRMGEMLGEGAYG